MSNRTLELPTDKNSRLNWIGFSDTGSIISYESSGRVMSYNIKRNLWMPICDLNEHVIGASDNFFIVGVSEKSQKIRASLCRGISYPLTNPRPILREIDYSLPLCHMETEKSKLEEALIRSTSFEMDSSDKEIVEKALKLFSTAMNSELESRAFEIVELIGEKKLIELAAKYSSQKGRMHLTGKIMKLLSDHEEKEEEKKIIANALDKDEKGKKIIFQIIFIS
jgi:chromosome transmission fidelity protein 4